MPNKKLILFLLMLRANFNNQWAYLWKKTSQSRSHTYLVMYSVCQNGHCFLNSAPKINKHFNFFFLKILGKMFNDLRQKDFFKNNFFGKMQTLHFVIIGKSSLSWIKLCHVILKKTKTFMKGLLIHTLGVNLSPVPLLLCSTLLLSFAKLTSSINILLSSLMTSLGWGLASALGTGTSSG